MQSSSNETDGGLKMREVAEQIALKKKIEEVWNQKPTRNQFVPAEMLLMKKLVQQGKQPLKSAMRQVL